MAIAKKSAKWYFSDIKENSMQDVLENLKRPRITKMLKWPSKTFPYHQLKLSFQMILQINCAFLKVFQTAKLKGRYRNAIFTPYPHTGNPLQYQHPAPECYICNTSESTSTHSHPWSSESDYGALLKLCITCVWTSV